MNRFPITDDNIERGRLKKAVHYCQVSDIDHHHNELPKNKYLVASENANIHYVSIAPDLTCDCRDWIMKGVRDEGWEKGLLCKHILAVLYHVEENEDVIVAARGYGIL